MIPASVVRDAPLSPFFLSRDVDALIRASAAVERHSSGGITHPDTYNYRTKKPERGGIHCARVFGPIEDLSCICGRLRGPERDGEVCDRCGVLCARTSLRSERWGHIESPLPLIHPGLGPRIAGELGISVEVLADVLRFEANLHEDGGVVHARPTEYGGLSFEDPEEEVSSARGPRHLHQLLAGTAPELFITRVPVTPSGWRVTPRDPQDNAYMALVNRCNRLTRLIELNAPKIIIDNEERMTQQAFERVCFDVRDELQAILDWRPSAPVTPRSATLLQAIYRDPDDDELREAYADALAEHDDPRAEFIRMQLDRAGSRRCRRAPKPERDLLRRHQRAWLAPLERAVERVEFRRGFPYAGRTVRAHAEGRVGDPAWSTFEELETDLPELIAHPNLRVLRRVKVRWACLRQLLEQGRRLPQLCAAEVQLRGAPPSGADAVVQSDMFPELRELTLAQRSTRAASRWEWLSGTPMARRLDQLTLTLGDDHLETISLPRWSEFLAQHPGLRLTINIGRTIELTLTHESGYLTVRGRTSRALAERVALGNEELAEQLGRMLGALDPDALQELRLRSQGPWYSEPLGHLVAELQARFGDRATLPRFHS